MLLCAVMLYKINSRMNNRYTSSLLVAVLATTLMHAQQTVQINNTNILQQVPGTPVQNPQRASTGNSSRQPSTLLLNVSVLSNVLIIPAQGGGPNGPNGTARPSTPQRQAATPARGVSRPNTGTTTPQRRPANPATPQRASNPATPQRASNPAPQRQVAVGGPNVSGVIAQPVQFRGGPNGPNGVGNPMPININVNPILSNTIPVQLVNDNNSNDNNPINVTRGNQNFVFELNNDIDRGMRGNININVPEVQLQAPQINLPKANKVEMPEVNLPKVTLPKIKTGGSGGSGGGKLKKSPQFNLKSSLKSFKRDFRHKWRKFSRKRSKMRYRVAECFFSGC